MVATDSQISARRGAVWKQLADTFSPLPEWPDPEKAPWPGWENWGAEF